MANPYQYQGSGQGFLTDYSNLAAAGSAFQGFAQGFQNAQDSKMKRLEQQAQLEAIKTKTDREKFQSTIEAANQGFSQNSDGTLSPAALTPKQKGLNQLKAIGEGVKSTGEDEYGNPTGYETDPNSPKMQQVKAMANQRQTTNDFKQETQDRLKDAMDRREHEKVISRVNANPNIKQRLTQYQNLDNNLSNIANADVVTPEMFNEFQQSVRSNLGIKGTSGVDERSGTYLKSLGLKGESWAQFLSGVPQDIGQRNKFLEHIKNLAQLEQKNISGQFDKSLEAASSGHKSMYARRQDLKDDLKDALSAQRAQMETAPQQQDQQQGNTPPQGLVQPGILTRAAGMLGFGGQGPAPDVENYAKAHNISIQQAQAIKDARTQTGAR